jgi:hypothetical protein
MLYLRAKDITMSPIHVKVITSSVSCLKPVIICYLFAPQVKIISAANVVSRDAVVFGTKTVFLIIFYNGPFFILKY